MLVFIEDIKERGKFYQNLKLFLVMQIRVHLPTVIDGKNSN